MLVVGLVKKEKVQKDKVKKVKQQKPVVSTSSLVNEKMSNTYKYKRIKII